MNGSLRRAKWRREKSLYTDSIGMSCPLLNLTHSVSKENNLSLLKRKKNPKHNNLILCCLYPMPSTSYSNVGELLVYVAITPTVISKLHRAAVM